VAIQKIQRYQTEQKYAAEKKVAELQILAINNQLNPHFTFNILNSIGNLFRQQDTEKADYIFGKYSKLLSKTILNSDNIRTTIGEEIEYVKNYLDLEKFRLSNDLKYDVLMAATVNSGTLIPKMLIYTFIENAIKHGIRHLSGQGTLNIKISQNNNDYEIRITDNGIGREMAKKTAIFSTGKGLKILDQILDLYQNLEGIKITYSLQDMYDSQNNPSGTEAIINVPISK
jgi:sensor histidine kinase YesM